MHRQLIAVSLITAIAQLAAFVKVWVTARLFGVGAELDGYNLALVVPTLLSGMLSAVLQTGLFPVRARLAVEKPAEEVAAFERAVLLGLLTLGIALTFLLWSMQPLLEPWIAPGAPTSVLQSLRDVWPFVVWLVMFNLFGDGLSFLLALRDRYPYAAAAPIANAVIGTAILLAYPQSGAIALALSTVAGHAVQVALCAIALRRSPFILFGPLPRFAVMWPHVHQIARLGKWMVLGALFANLTATMPTVLLASFGEGAISAFRYAQQFHSQLVQLLVMAGSPILLARFSDLVARGDEVGVARILGRAGRFSVAAGASLFLAVWLFGSPVLAWLFGGRFDDAAAERVGLHWLWLSLGLAPAIWGNVFAKLWQARGKALQMTGLAAAGFGVFWGSAYLAEWAIGEFTVPAGITLSSFIVLAMFLALEWRRKLILRMAWSERKPKEVSK